MEGSNFASGTDTLFGFKKGDDVDTWDDVMIDEDVDDVIEFIMIPPDDVPFAESDPDPHASPFDDTCTIPFDPTS